MELIGLCMGCAYVRGVRVRVRVCVRVRVLVRVPLHPCMEEVKDMSFVCWREVWKKFGRSVKV